MPKIRSAKKALRQNEKRRLRNKAVRSHTRTMVKNALTSFENNENGATALSSAYSALDRAAKKGIIHRRQADRKKARLARRLNKLNAENK